MSTKLPTRAFAGLSLSAAIGWALVLAAMVVGFVGYGWPGLVLAITVIVFWMLLQFSRALRAMRQASGRPVGQVDNAVMLHAQLRPGLRLVEVLKLTRSLGTALHTGLHEVDERFAWVDAAGDRVEVELHQGRVTAWQLLRADRAADDRLDGQTDGQTDGTVAPDA
jgi:hypothetical protein